MTLFEKIKSVGIPYTNHFSDLYVQDSRLLRKILKEYPRENKAASLFIYQGGIHQGERWVDIPFAYDPFWASRGGRPNIQLSI